MGWPSVVVLVLALLFLTYAIYQGWIKDDWDD
jgi:hypothetical protein